MIVLTATDVRSNGLIKQVGVRQEIDRGAGLVVLESIDTGIVAASRVPGMCSIGRRVYRPE